MTALDALQAAATTANDALEGSMSAAADLATQTEDVAEELAALGSEGSAQLLTQSAAPRLATVRDHLANARQELEALIEDCERAKGIGGSSAQQSGGSSTGMSPTRAGWNAPAVAGNSLRVDPATVRVPVERRTHILDGEEHGGGHRHGTGTPNKTEFPQRWSDDTTMGYVAATARAPERVDFLPAAGRRPDRWMCQSEHDDVMVTTIVYPDGRVWAAWPEPGGRGVVRNEGKKA